MNEAETSPCPPVISPCVPGIAQSLGLGALFYGIVVPLAVGLDCLKRLAGVPLDVSQWSLVVQMVAWQFILWAGLRWSKVPFRVAYPLRRFPVRILPGLLIASVGAIILLDAVAALIPISELWKSAVHEITGSHKLALFLSMVLAAPLAEELFFRGWVLRGYLGRYSITKAVWASSAFFAVFHFNPWQAAVALPLGLGFAWLFLRTGSLVPGILCHATANFTLNFLYSPLLFAFGYDAQAQKALSHRPPSMIALAGVLAGVGGFVVWRQLTKHPSERRA